MSILNKIRKVVKKEKLESVEDTIDKTNEEGQKDHKKDKKSNKEALEEQLAEKEIELAELKDKYLRIHAEFDNFRKRTIKEKMDFMRTASQEIIEDLLPVLDDFDRAKKVSDDENTEEQFSDGVALVYNKFSNVLKSQGLTAMESNGEPFDPELHEAITKIPAGSEDQKGKIVDTIEKGYLLKDKIIRYAKVVVAE